MWKRDEASRLTGMGAAGGQERESSGGDAAALRSGSGPASQLGKDVANIGKSVLIKGELSGSEDLTIEGQVEGKIELREHVLTVGPNGKIRAQVFAKVVIVLGKISGNIAATDKVSIRDGGSVEGDIAAPRVGIAEGARFRGSIDMRQAQVLKVTTNVRSAVKPAPAAARLTSLQSKYR